LPVSSETPGTNLQEDRPQPLARLLKGCPNHIQRSNLCAVPQKKPKFSVKNQEATVSFINYPNNPYCCHKVDLCSILGIIAL
jgi:hypothetical protein